MLFTEVAGVVEHDVEDNLHALGVSGINQALESNVLGRAPRSAALITEVHRADIHSVIAVEVSAGCILHHRGNPDSGKA